MTQEEIKARYLKLSEKMQKRQTSIEVLRMKMRGLQLQCSHPNQFTYSAMGELGKKCPDCGHQT